MTHEERLRQLIGNDERRLCVLHTVRELGLPDCWVGAGFVRSAVWDALHGIAPRLPDSDIDVIWFDPSNCASDLDAELEAALCKMRPGLEWSVRNQARMHIRNGDAPYDGAVDAMRHWPETATAVALRCTADGRIEVAAPFGLGDLWDGILRPTPTFAGDRHPISMRRVAARRWLQHWPRLRLMLA